MTLSVERSHLGGVNGLTAVNGGTTDRLKALKWLRPAGERAYEVTSAGVAGLGRMGVDVEAARAARRRFATACLDWSERRYHLAGALGAAVLATALRRKWIVRDLDSRIVTLTSHGQRELEAALGIDRP